MRNCTKLTRLIVTEGISALRLGEIDHKATSGSAIKLFTLPKGCAVTKLICVVSAAFNSGTSDSLILGTSADDDAYMASGDITETAAGRYDKNVYIAPETAVYAKLTKTGTAATAGKAYIYGEVITL